MSTKQYFYIRIRLFNWPSFQCITDVVYEFHRVIYSSNPGRTAMQQLMNRYKLLPGGKANTNMYTSISLLRVEAKQSVGSSKYNVHIICCYSNNRAKRAMNKCVMYLLCSVI